MSSTDAGTDVDVNAREAAPPRADESPRVADLLRWLGASLLVVAASSFLFKAWGEQRDVVRYGMLLAQLVVMSVSGFIVAMKVKEKRGARVFLGLTALVVPVHFAVLGGILYSQFAVDAPPNHLAQYAVWRAESPQIAIALAVGAQLVLIPAVFVSMLTLVRRHAVAMTIFYVLLNAALLIPLRAPMTMTWIFVATIPVLVFAQSVFARGSPTLETPQGRAVRLMLTLPVGLLVGRTLLHYAATQQMIGAAFVAAGIVVAGLVSRGRADTAGPRVFVQVLALVVSAIGWCVAVGEGVLVRTLLDLSPRATDLPLLALPICALMWVFAALAPVGAQWFRRFGAIGAGATMLVNILPFHSFEESAACVGVGLIVATYGVAYRQKVVVAAGALPMIAGVIGLLASVVHFDTLTHWITLSVLGIVLIFAASFIERSKRLIIERLAAVRANLQSWGH